MDEAILILGKIKAAEIKPTLEPVLSPGGSISIMTVLKLSPRVVLDG